MKIISLLLISLCIFFAITFFYKKSFISNKNYGTIIILNGPSASGKSSLQKEFQNLMMPKLWIKIGIDNFFDATMPEITPQNMEYWQSKNDIRWVETSEDKDNNKVITLFVGKEGEKSIYGMNSAIAAYAKNGCNIIVDYIAYKKEWLEDLQQKLKPFKTYYVATKITLDELEKREAARGTSPIGHARSHYHTVYGDIKYDLILNSGKHCSKELAKQLKDFIKNHA